MKNVHAALFHAVKCIKSIKLQKDKKNMESSPSYTLFTSGIMHNVVYFQGLVEVITSSDDSVSVRATILLGELLHMVLYSNYCNRKYSLILDYISYNLK